MIKWDTEKQQLILDEVTVPCRLLRSDRRTLGLEIRRCPEGGELLIRAPGRMKISDIERFIITKKQWITDKYQSVLVDKACQKPVEIPAYMTRQWLKTEGVRVFQNRIDFWALRMHVTYGKVTLRDQKTRWGSCSSRGNLNFNWRLLLMPEAVMDYVIVHELAHRREMNHSERFWFIVEKYIPDYSVHRQWLKENGSSYSVPVTLP